MLDRRSSQRTDASHEHKATIDLDRQSNSGLGDTQISRAEHKNTNEIMLKL